MAQDQFRTSKELRSDLAALSLRLAFQEELEDEVDTLVQESKKPDPALLEIIDQADPRVIQKIRKGLRRKNIRHAAVTVLPRLGKAVAALLLVFFIGLSTAIATVPSVRVMVLNFIMKIENDHTSMGFVNTGKSIEVPAEWKGYYFPTYIPEGFALKSTDGYEVNFVNQAGAILTFCEVNSIIISNIDTEGANVRFTDVEGHNLLISEKGEWITLVWAVSNRYFIIEFQGSEQEALRIMKSVIMLK